jgi:ribosomal protein L11 methyltransferase
MECGACATWIVDADRGTENESPLFNEPVYSVTDIKNVSSLLSIPWAAAMWNSCNVTALFPSSVDIVNTVLAVREVFAGIVTTSATGYMDESLTTLSNFENGGVPTATSNTSPLTSTMPLDSYTIEAVPQKDWVVSVQKGWRPIVVANSFILRFPWHTDEDVTEVMQDYYNDFEKDMEAPLLSRKPLISILLQGGIAFGTGEHATTKLCLEWLHENVSAMLQQQSSSSDSESKLLRVLDYGTGSGILGLAACAIGRQNKLINHTENTNMHVSAVGIDLDVDACQIANANAVLNGNLPMQSYLPSLSMLNVENTAIDAESQSLLFKAYYNQQQKQTRDGSENELILDHVLEPFDICVANILAGPLIVLAPTLYQMLKAGAYIGMSGILQHQGDAIVQAYQSAGFTNVEVKKDLDGWVLVTAQRPPTSY